MERITVLARASNEKQGIWLTYMEDFEVKIASICTLAYLAAQREVIKDKILEVRKLGLQALTPEDMRRIYAQSVVLDWRGYTDQGQPIPFSYAECISLMEKDERFFRWVTVNAEADGNFRAIMREEGKKNSQPSCVGKRTTANTNSGTRTSRKRGRS